MQCALSINNINPDRANRSSIPSLPDDASSQDSVDSASQVDARNPAADGRVDQEPDIVMVIPLDTNRCDEPPGKLARFNNMIEAWGLKRFPISCHFSLIC